MKRVQIRRRGDRGTRGKAFSLASTSHHVAASGFRVASFILSIALLALAINFTAASRAQQRRNGAHSASAPEAFTPADRRLVERAIGETCAERIRDPLGSMPIDEMQTRPSLPVSNSDAMAGARRAELLLPATKRLVVVAIVQLAKDYGLYGPAVVRTTAVPTRPRVSRNSTRRRTGRSATSRPGIVDLRARVNAAAARVEAVRRIKPDVDSRDNASVLLRDPRVIDFGTIFLAGLRSDEAMISVLAHELTHIASGEANSLRPLFRAIARRAAVRTGLSIQGQRAEELACDLVGMTAARAFIKETPSWEPLPRRLARAVEHNCVDDDASDDDHLSPRSTIRALFALDVGLASEVLTDGTLGWLSIRPEWSIVSKDMYSGSVHILDRRASLLPGTRALSPAQRAQHAQIFTSLEDYEANAFRASRSMRARVRHPSRAARPGTPHAALPAFSSAPGIRLTYYQYVF